MQLRRFLFHKVSANLPWRQFAQMGLLLVIVSLFLSLHVPVQAQSDDPVELQVSAAYRGFFRPNMWLPLQIHVRNDGINIRGRISVRPETTGRNVATAYSTPIELPTGSEKNIYLYIQAKEGADRVVVELMTEDGVRVAEQAVNLIPIHAQDSLYVVVSATAANNLNFNDVGATTFEARQVRWGLENVPPQYQALMAINTLVLYDVNSEDFTVGQHSAIEQWVTMGGHLIVIGGPNWAQTSNSLNDWLPFLPTSSQNVSELDELNRYVNNRTSLQGRTVVTTGNVTEDAQVLVETDDGLPLYIQREMGLGTVDYFTVDPTLEPIRTWNSQGDFWRNIVMSRNPQPGWIRGILDHDYAARAVAILPGEDLLPSVGSMIAFILAYIVLIGPVNYWILSRFNRRALGWITIPLFIAIFTTLAWTVGFNLRGSDIIVSRQFIVQSFVGEDMARQDELIGIFSPRRETYTITAPSDTFLEILPSLTGDNILQPGVQRSTVEIVQSDRFIAEDVTIDGGIFANFALSSSVEAPAISGSVSLAYDAVDEETTRRAIRGVVRNDSDIDLEDAVILVGNQFYWVEETIEAGDLLNFDSNDFRLIHAEDKYLFPLASPLEYSYALDLGRYSVTSPVFVSTIMTSQVILGTTAWTTAARFRDDIVYDDNISSESKRRESLLFSFIRDQYATGNIGNRAFLAGWSEESRDKDIVIEETDYRVLDTSFYMIELDVELEEPSPNETLTLGTDQFTWTFLSRDENSIGGIDNFYIINPGEVEIRFMPLEGAVLDNVSKMTVALDRSGSYGREIDFTIWNWRLRIWEDPSPIFAETTYELENPSDYLGPNNVVDVRVALDRNTSNLAASVRIRGIRVTQTGSFE